MPDTFALTPDDERYAFAKFDIPRGFVEQYRAPIEELTGLDLESAEVMGEVNWHVLASAIRKEPPEGGPIHNINIIDIALREWQDQQRLLD